LAMLEDLEDLQSWQGGLEAHALKFVGRGHDYRPRRETRGRMISAFHPGPPADGTMNTDTPSALRHGASMRGGPNISSSPNTSSPARLRPGRTALRVAGTCLAASALLALAACSSNDPTRSGLLEPYRI